MRRAALLVWLLALVAFAFPVGIAPSAQAHHAEMSDCPDKDTGKHAAGTCCPLMAGAVAVLPATAGTAPSIVVPHVVSPSHNLTGLTYAKEPPPPRV